MAKRLTFTAYVRYVKTVEFDDSDDAAAIIASVKAENVMTDGTWEPEGWAEPSVTEEETKE